MQTLRHCAVGLGTIGCGCVQVEHLRAVNLVEEDRPNASPAARAAKQLLQAQPVHLHVVRFVTDMCAQIE